MDISKQFEKSGQVPMFATPRQIIDGVNMVDLGSSLHHLYPDTEPWDTTDEQRTAAKEHLMSAKFDEASEDPKGPYPSGHRGGLTSEVVDRGYDWSKPIAIHVDPAQPEGKKLTLTDGHHRLAIMAHLHPDQFIPITSALSRGAAWPDGTRNV